MADISKCADSLCPSKETCYRYTAPASMYWQSYGSFNREEDEDNCNMYWETIEAVKQLQILFIINMFKHNF